MNPTQKGFRLSSCGEDEKGQRVLRTSKLGGQRGPEDGAAAVGHHCARNEALQRGGLQARVLSALETSLSHPEMARVAKQCAIARTWAASLATPQVLFDLKWA